MFKTAIIGASGFVGRHFFQAYRRHFPDTIGTTFSKSSPDLVTFDLRQTDVSALRLRETGVRDVIIASAKPNIGYCEQNKDASYDVNVTGTLRVARQIAELGIRILFLSSDYVFDGRTGQYDDHATPNPTTEYGRQKALVEKELVGQFPNSLVLRLSKIYGVERGDNTLLDDFANSLLQGKELRVATDQVFSPTYVGDLVNAIDVIQRSGESGVINVCAPEPFSRFDVAKMMAEELQLERPALVPIRLHDLAGMAGRPLNTSMRPGRLSRMPGVSFIPLSRAAKQVASLWRT